MKNFLFLLVFITAVLNTSARADSEEEMLTSMLNEFLAGASVNDVAAHDRFWAEDLVYTSSRGLRFGKAEILEGMNSDDESDDEEEAVVYTAEDIRIRPPGLA